MSAPAPTQPEPVPLTKTGKALITVGIVSIGVSASLATLFHNPDLGVVFANLGTACSLASHIWG